MCGQPGASVASEPELLAQPLLSEVSAMAVGCEAGLNCVVTNEPIPCLHHEFSDDSLSPLVQSFQRTGLRNEKTFTALIWFLTVLSPVL